VKAVGRWLKTDVGSALERARATPTRDSRGSSSGDLSEHDQRAVYRCLRVSPRINEEPVDSILSNMS
jgi:hypothetical protein